MKKRYYKWQDLEKDMTKLAKQIDDTQIAFKNIFPVARGGLVPSVMLSHKLDIPIVLDKKYISKYTLIVDEVVATGKTLHHLKKFNVVCIHWKPKTASFEPKFYARKTSEWIVYPWELK